MFYFHECKAANKITLYATSFCPRLHIIITINIRIYDSNDYKNHLI